MKLILLLCLVIVRAAVAADSASPLEKGDALDRQGKTQEALAVYLEADKAAPNEAGTLHRIARGYGLSMTDAGNKAEKKAQGLRALDYAKRAVAADAGNAQAQLALAVSYGRVAPLLDNKTKIAYSKLVKEHADKALKLDPSNDLTHHVLGAWHYEVANLNAVLRAIASALYGSVPKASNATAVEHFKRAIVLNPKRLANHIELGRTYAAMGDNAAARAALEKGLAMPAREKDDPETKARGRAALADL